MSELAKALVEAQKEMPAVPKNATAEVPTKSGGKYSYSYVTLDSLIAKTLPVLNAAGIAITQAPEFIEGFGLGLRTTLTHSSGESATSLMPIQHPGHSMQDIGGAITYARRYAWASVLGIASEHDDDAGAITHANGHTETRTHDAHGYAESRADATHTNGDPGSVKLTFGKHKDKALRDVPEAYLTWWLGQEARPEQAALRASVEMFVLGTPEGATVRDPDADIPF